MASSSLSSFVFVIAVLSFIPCVVCSYIPHSFWSLPVIPLSERTFILQVLGIWEVWARVFLVESMAPELGWGRGQAGNGQINWSWSAFRMAGVGEFPSTQVEILDSFLPPDFLCPRRRKPYLPEPCGPREQSRAEISKCKCIPCITEGKQWSPAWKYRRLQHPAGGRTVAFGFTVSLPALLHTPLHGKEACDGITVLRWRSGRNRKFCSLTGKNWIQHWVFLTPYDQLINCCRCRYPLAVSEGYRAPHWLWRDAAEADHALLREFMR